MRRAEGKFLRIVGLERDSQLEDVIDDEEHERCQNTCDIAGTEW